MSKKIEEIKNELKSRIAVIDKRIKNRSGANFLLRPKR